MAAEYICDGCGVRAKAVRYSRGAWGWHKPGSWYQRQDEEGIQDACDRACIDKIAATSGKTGVVLPI